jgi:tryptophan synthase beta subunit
MSPDEAIIINQSGRGDKDIFTVADASRSGLAGIYNREGGAI